MAHSITPYRLFLAAFVQQFFIIAFVLSSSMSLLAQEGKQSLLDQLILDDGLREYMNRAEAKNTMFSFPQENIDTVIDALSYDVTLDWVDALRLSKAQRQQRKFNGHVRAVVRVVAPTPFLPLFARNLIIDSVLVNGIIAQWGAEESSLNISSSSGFSTGDTVTIDLYYASTRDDRGFYVYAGSDVDGKDVLHPIAFTFSEPEDARSWFPCNDVPSDKALFTVHVRVPKGITVVSNGVMIDSTADTDTTTVQSWQHPHPMSTYLFTVNASVFSRLDLEYVSDRTIPILNYQWPEDLDGQPFSAVKALARIPLMFEGLEKYLGAYPWPTYGHVTVSPINIGGMEHQTMSTINRRWLLGDLDVGYVHELSHQWLGDAITGAIWGDIWLGEGGATFSEALWREYFEGPQGYTSQLDRHRNKYMERGLLEPPVYNPSMDSLFNEATTYSKAGWIFHMMRRVAGDSLFFPMLKKWISRNYHQPRQTNDFLAHVRTEIPNPPVPWQDYWVTFFNQWLIQRGHPVIGVVLDPDPVPTNGVFSGVLRIEQYQKGDNIPDAFLFPLTISLLADFAGRDTVIYVDQRQTVIPIQADFVVSSIAVDPYKSTLMQVIKQSVTSVNESYRLEGIVVQPVPINRGEPLTINSNEAEATVMVYSVQGSLLGTYRLGAGANKIDTASWPLGVIIVSMESRGKIFVRTIPVIN
ncbi:MAG: M1 family metallopeptidase [Ignavibacteria bacterium]|nr:M1 family metallopeptidase [Ignavibacteria bacterium]